MAWSGGSRVGVGNTGTYVRSQLGMRAGFVGKAGHYEVLMGLVIVFITYLRTQQGWVEGAISAGQEHRIIDRTCVLEHAYKGTAGTHYPWERGVFRAKKIIVRA